MNKFKLSDVLYLIGGFIAGLVTSYIFEGLTHHHLFLAILGAIVGGVIGKLHSKKVFKSVLVGVVVGGAGSYLVSFVLGLPIISSLYHLAFAAAGVVVTAAVIIRRRAQRKSTI